MLKIRELKVYIEDTETFHKKLSKDLKAIDRGEADTLSEDSISFKSIDQLRKCLTEKRLELIRVIRKKKPKSIYELAKMVSRKTENVNADIKLLHMWGFVHIDKVKDKRRRSVPKVNFDSISLDLGLHR